MYNDFTQNLQLLCSHYKSIAEVCRELGINRTQFNRYLSGATTPSANSMLRICEFFGVDKHELFLPHEKFQLLTQVKPRQAVKENEAPQDSHIVKLLQKGSSGLDKYLGYYFECYQSMACPGKILRTLVCLEERDGHVYFQRTERLKERADEKAYNAIYLGVAMLLTDRLFLLDYESLTGNEVTQTILFPSFKNRVSRLSGLKQGVSGSGERMPCCARVVYEYLGKSVDKYKALSMCKLYDQDTTEIPEAIKAAIDNTLDESEWHFRAKHL